MYLSLPKIGSRHAKTAKTVIKAQEILAGEGKAQRVK